MTKQHAVLSQKGPPLAPPGFLPSLLVALASRVLPSGSRRSRYRQEFKAELYGMPRRRQTAHALQIAASSWSLRSAIASPQRKGRDMLAIVRRKPLLCLLNVRHHWHMESTPDGDRYQRCTKCGKDRDEYPIRFDWQGRDKFGL
jgi:hypothetical protein